MKRNRIVGALLLFLLPLLAWVGIASAQTFRTGDITTVPSDETVNSSLYASGRTIDIAGTVDGDVICAGMNVTVSGTVKGDVICAGQNVTVSGTVEGNVRLAGQNVTLSGQVAKNASVATSAFTFESKGRVGSDLAVAGADIILSGQVGRDAALAGATATLNSKIGRNVNASVENINLRGQAEVGGGLYYTSANEANVDQGAKVTGETIRTAPKQEKGTFEAPYVSGFGFVMYLIVSLLIVALALVLLFPAVIHDTTDIALAKPWKVLLTGFVASIAVPVLIIILMITVLGIPLALLLLLIWLVLQFLAGPVASYYAGRLMLKGQKNPLLIMALGATVVLLLMFVPVLGFIVWLAVIWMGTGMLLLQLMRRTPRPQYVIADTVDTEKPKKR